MPLSPIGRTWLYIGTIILGGGLAIGYSISDCSISLPTGDGGWWRD